MSNVVRLTVHKNNREQRERRVVRGKLVTAAKVIAREFSPDGFALVAYKHSDDGESTSFDVRYYAKNGFEVHALPDAVRSAIDAKIVEDIAKGS